MKNYSSTAMAVLLTLSLLAASSTDTFAKETKQFQPGDPMPTRSGRTRGAFNKNNTIGWAWVRAQCSTGNTNTVECAQAAVLEASVECGEAAKFFRKGSETWQWISFSLILASAASTAVGASTTVANSKIWSTLGGTTGIGAVTTTANSNVSADQNAIVSVNTILDSLNTTVTADGTSYAHIYETAAIYANKCAAVANSSSGTTQLTQSTKPGAPTIGSATAGPGQASVTFTAPQTNGGAAITSYTVSANPGGASAVGASSPITVTGLNAGTPYSFTVSATNSAGTGAPSAASNAVIPLPPTVPGAPTIGSATPGAGRALVTFAAPQSNGGAAITSYTVIASPGGATVTGASSPITVTGLTAGTSYSFTVTATNSAGTSAASAASNSVAPN
jgi:hypothetical protein